jgi:hypothetical protein
MQFLTISRMHTDLSAMPISLPCSKTKLSARAPCISKARCARSGIAEMSAARARCWRRVAKERRERSLAPYPSSKQAAGTREPDPAAALSRLRTPQLIKISMILGLVWPNLDNPARLDGGAPADEKHSQCQSATHLELLSCYLLYAICEVPPPSELP